jgi:hypothetical protein
MAKHRVVADVTVDGCVLRVPPDCPVKKGDRVIGEVERWVRTENGHWVFGLVIDDEKIWSAVVHGGSVSMSCRRRVVHVRWWGRVVRKIWGSIR